MGFLTELIKTLSEDEIRGKRTRSNDELVSLKELFETYNPGFFFEYDEIESYLQKKFGEVASNIFISYNDYDCVVQGCLDSYSIERFCCWLEYRIQAMNIDISKERIKLVRNERKKLMAVKI